MAVDSPAADAHAAEPTRTVTAAPSRHTSRELTASRGEVRAVLRLRSEEGGTQVGVSLAACRAAPGAT